MNTPSKSRFAITIPRLRNLMVGGKESRYIETGDKTAKAQQLLTEGEHAMLMIRPATGNSAINALQSQLNETNANIVKQISANQESLEMVPELGRVSRILVNSVMSPIDMRESRFSIGLTNSGITDEGVTNSLKSLMSKIINDDLELGHRVPKWLETAGFLKGATPVVAIPRRTISVMGKKTKEEIENHTPSGTTVYALEHCSIVDNVVVVEDESKLSLLSGQQVTFGLESIGELVENQVCTSTAVDATDEFNKLMDGVLNHLDVTLDYRKINAGIESVNKVDEAVKNRLGVLNPLGGSGGLLTLDPLRQSDPDGLGCAIIRVPTSAVHPIILPGAPETKVGFLLAIDENGTPLDSDFGATTSAAYMNESEYMKQLTGMAGISSGATVSAEKRSADAAAIFDMVLQNVLNTSMDQLGISTFDVADQGALSSCVFSKILKNKKVNLVFLPASMVAYYAFAFNEDGTGKSFLDGIRILGSMRTACLVSRVVSMMTNATDQHRIEYSMNENSGTSIKQMNAQLSKMFKEKYMPTFPANADSALQGIFDRSIQTVPKEFKNTKNLRIDTSTQQRNLSSVDTETEDLLTKLILMNQPVPQGTVDETFERDFSRSVVTTNILMANDVSRYQQMVCRETRILARVALNASGKFAKGAAEILMGIVDNQETVKTLINQIISGFTLTLPSPNIGPDSVRIEEISRHIELIDRVIEHYWSDELIFSEEDRTLQEAYKAMKVLIKQAKIRELIDSSGDAVLSSIPDIANIDFDRYLKTVNSAEHLKALSKLVEDAVKAKVEEADTGGGSTWR